MIFFQVHSALVTRLKFINYTDAYNQDLIKKIINFKHVHVSPEIELRKIVNYYYPFNLIITGEDNYFYLQGFPIRKNLDSTLKKRLKNL
jgi:hypothetical protein